jgi:hypothetical protein
MNVERLYEIVTYLREKDSELGLQRLLADLKTHIANLASSPQNESYQSSVASAFNSLQSVFERFESETTPPQKILIEEINGKPFFSIEMVRSLKEKFAENAITPALVNSYVAELTTNRDVYLTTLAAIKEGLHSFGVEEEEPSPGDVELGVLIPRDLFHNELGDLAQEFEVINRIIQFFSEVITGSVQPVTVRQISTSDPTIFLGVPVAVVLAIGKTTDWLIEKWKSIEEIRKIRAEVSKLDVEAAIKPLDDKIDELVKASIQQQVAELSSQYKLNDRGRKNELEAGLHWALDSLISRIERGMTIEIRVLAPPQENPDNDDAGQSEMYTEVDTVGRRLQTVRIFQEQPILKLPPPQPPQAAEHKQEPEAKSRRIKT